MSWARVYHLILRLLPAELRRKHGRAMEALFAHELDRARERGRLRYTLAGTLGVWDVTAGLSTSVAGEESKRSTG